MNTAILLLVAVTVGSVGAYEAFRKLRDWRDDRFGNRVWIGVDLGSDTDRCGGHGGVIIAASKNDAPGKCGEITPSFGMTGGAEQ